MWKPEHSQAATELKEALMNMTVTKISDPEFPIVLKTEVLKHEVGAVLEQYGHPGAFGPRRKSDRELHCAAYEGELLATVYAPMKWRHFTGTE